MKARGEASAADLRVAVPTLEPEPAFLAQLSGLAAGSGAADSPAGTLRPGWRVGLVAASVATVMVSGAWVAAAVMGGNDGAPDRPTAPVTQPVEPPSQGHGSGSDTNNDHADRGGDPAGTPGRNHEGDGPPADQGAAVPPATGDDAGGLQVREGRQDPAPEPEQLEQDAPAEQHENDPAGPVDDDQVADDDNDERTEEYPDPGDESGSGGAGDDDQGAESLVDEHGDED